MTHSRPALRDLLDDHGLAPRRDLGQNFVTDANTVRRIAELAGVGPGDHVVEIGAGLGSLTLALAETGASVTAIEVDHGIVAVLREVVEHLDRVTVVEADAMDLGWVDLVEAHRAGGAGRGIGAAIGRGRPWTLVANLPYNVATPLVCDILDRVPQVGRLLVMVQREVAERFAAPAGARARGAVSVKVAYWGRARVVGHVPATVFLPRPNVESSLVEIVRRTPPAVPPDDLFDLVRTAFGQRRKMLRRSLGALVEPSAFGAAEVAETARPEELDLDAWVRLARAATSAGTTDTTAGGGHAAADGDGADDEAGDAT
ncbi:16S rRNA (adenine(1518)-N(6)/adenine(1519)-N(6))-dimethyltransferase RsmA [Ilumatobacter sp.]|uniref:16S rRNA (adenine(1518)-N(6)/adenine(1519)-N(6))- dimethyltransferase RsmA n=1 Tax=Ilumatobacter sp. TaxID=1967498 RepID=UPI003B515719